jgi:hypothetical protein
LGDFLFVLFAICFLLKEYLYFRHHRFLCLAVEYAIYTLRSMSDTNKAFYVTSVANGHVLANKSDGRPSDVVVENKGDQSDAEKWTIEASDEPNKIALKNAANGRYLRANGNKCWATVGTGEKQWWKISSDGVTAPGACRLSPVEYPDVSLNHFQGKTVRRGGGGIKVHMWTFLVWVTHSILQRQIPDDLIIARTRVLVQLLSDGNQSHLQPPHLWRWRRRRNQGRL